MSDYRYQIVEHKGITCLHVMIDGDEIATTHIPLDDVLRSALEQGWKPPRIELGEGTRHSDTCVPSAPLTRWPSGKTKVL